MTKGQALKIGTMNPTGNTKITHAMRSFGFAGVLMGIVSGFGAPHAQAQNAAQRTALTRLRATHPNAIPANGVEAINVPLGRPAGLAFDAAGNLYIADTDHNMVREVTVDGTINTVAGTGEQGFAGDGGAATSAELDSPVGIAVDAAGNLYIADTHNNRIRAVIGGAIKTIAGTGVAGFSGDGNAATAAGLNLPTAIAVDSNGNLYIADTNNHRIRKITGTTITTVAGDGEQTYSGDGGLAASAGLDSPSGVAVDAAFNIYIGDTHNQRVRVVTAATGTITTLVGKGVKGFNGDGAAGTAELSRPRGVAVDGSGNVYVADSDNNRVRAVNSGTISTIAGDGSEGISGDGGAATSASLDTPDAVATNGGLVAVSDTENQRVIEVQNGALNTIGGQGNGTESLNVNGPLSVVYGAGSLTVTFKNGSNVATGIVTLYDNAEVNPVAIGTLSFSGNVGTFSTTTLSAGTHFILAYYAGDANDPAIASGVYVLSVTPVQLTATANAVNLLYGQAIPALTGTLSGVLPQDSGNVTATYTATATATSPPGTYPISVALTGSAAGNYTLVLSGTSGSVLIAKAPTTTTLTVSNASPIVGKPVTFTATVASTTAGTPTGTANFYSGGTLLNATPATLNNGVATLTISTLALGSQTITAVYSGETDFVTSTSNVVTEAILPSPEFTFAASPGSQTILPGATANYTLTLTPANSTFVNAVSFSVNGLPAGATATFTPSSIAVGSGASNAVLAITISKQSALVERKPSGGLHIPAALALLLLPLAFSRRARRTATTLSRRSRMLTLLLMLAMLGGLTACGGGGFFSHPVQTSTVTVTAVSGSVTHTTSITLTVQ